jgi:hypothetical protein
MREIEKPVGLQARGCWFDFGDRPFHIGVERDFSPSKKAHPAFATAYFDELRHALRARGFTVTDHDPLPGTRRFYSQDPWGNRLEFVETRT